MNPFACPDNIYVAKRPQDMRAGINRLMSVVAAELLDDPADGSLYVFVSKDARKCKMLRHDGNGWILYYCTMTGGAFKWHGGEDPADPVLCIRRNQLLWLLDGLTVEQPKAVPPSAARTVL